MKIKIQPFQGEFSIQKGLSGKHYSFFVAAAFPANVHLFSR